MAEKRGLGRGLSELIGELGVGGGPADRGAGLAARSKGTATDSVMVPVELIRENPDQPRRQFAEEELDALSQSMKRHGVLQPILVRADPSGETTYQIVAGERRWRAAQMAQIHEIPVLVREFDDNQVLEIALVENVQRVDLNPVEEASGYRKLMDGFGHTQNSLSEILGRSRSHVANMVRLLGLPEDVQRLLVEGSLSVGHARALVSSRHPSRLAKLVVSRGLNVRQTEALARSEDGDAGGTKAKRTSKDADTRTLEAGLSANLKLPVSINHRKGTTGGSVRISYRTLDDLDDLCQRLGGIGDF